MNKGDFELVSKIFSYESCSTVLDEFILQSSAKIRDSFDRYVQYLPSDVALFSARIDFLISSGFAQNREDAISICKSVAVGLRQAEEF